MINIFKLQNHRNDMKKEVYSIINSCYQSVDFYNLFSNNKLNKVVTII